MESVCKFEFPSVEGVRLKYKEMCLRLHGILHSDTVLPRCYHCARFSCHSFFCLEVHCSKVAVDIGNKNSWVITQNLDIRRHLSMFGIPKMSPNESNIDRLVTLSSAFHVHSPCFGLKLTGLNKLL